MCFKNHLLPELGVAPPEARNSSVADGHQRGGLLVPHPDLHPLTLARREQTTPARELPDLLKGVRSSDNAIRN